MNPLPALSLDWDIFCAVIDNYGDAGVCWRLARQLVAEHGQAVRLWIDRPEVLACLLPTLAPGRDRQTVQGVEVRHWVGGLEGERPARVVVEAFACHVPDAFQVALRERGSLWVNLEYFSAEDWVEGCHGLPSLQAGGARKFFFFPGMTAATGGLLRERDLIARRDAFVSDASLRRAWCTCRGLPFPEAGERAVSLFAYEQPAIPALLQSLARAPQPGLLYVPQGRVLSSLNAVLPGGCPAPGQTCTLGALGRLRVHVLPFLPQEDYDALLWLCELNLVRGEDSLVRALWAGKPFLWQIYPTEDEAHRLKLEAFVARYTALAPEGAVGEWAEAMRAWNGQGVLVPEAVEALFIHPAWFRHASEALIREEDLATRLTKFVFDRV